VGYPERRPDGVYNSVAVVNADGTVRSPYRKIHLFGRECHYFRPGHCYVVQRLAGLTVGVLICYDLEFPECSRALALSGADLIAVSTANMAPYREAQDVYVRARARENQVFVALANRVGREGRTRFVGGSGVWDPQGTGLVHADTAERVLIASIDRSAVSRARRAFSYLRDRRPECYAVIAAQPRGKRGRRNSAG
jgi:predicted amidohydrolase